MLSIRAMVLHQRDKDVCETYKTNNELCRALQQIGIQQKIGYDGKPN